MLYYIRYRLKDDKVQDLAEEVKSGGFPYKAKHVYASMEDPFEGITIWEVDDDGSADTLVAKLKEFADVREIIPVVSAEDAQQKIFKKLS